MHPYGFTRVAAASPEMKVADVDFNKIKIIEMISEAQKQQVEYIVFPELCITGYTCADLFRQGILLEAAKDALLEITSYKKNSKIIVLIGLPIHICGRIYNCAAVLQDGEILGFVPKTHIPGYSEFYEPRWFASGAELEVETVQINDKQIPVGINLLFVSKTNNALCFGVEICEDVWVPLPPSSFFAKAGASLIFNFLIRISCIKSSGDKREKDSSNS